MKLAFDIDLCTLYGLKLFDKMKGEYIVFKLNGSENALEYGEVGKENIYLVFDRDGRSVYIGNYDSGRLEPAGEVILSDSEKTLIDHMIWS